MINILLIISTAMGAIQPSVIYPITTSTIEGVLEKNVQATVKASITIPSTSNIPVKTSSYINPTNVPTGISPFINVNRDSNGTVFIAVGTIILSILALLLIARFFFWLNNRKEAKSFDDIDDYYGNMYDYEKSIFGSKSSNQYNFDDEKINNNELTLQYDSRLFDEKRGAVNTTSSNNSYFTNHSSNPSTSSNTVISPSPQSTVLSPKQGRVLRNGTQIDPNQMVNIKRTSYISPINELVNNNDSKVSYSPVLEERHKKSSSISLLIARGDLESGSKTPVIGSQSVLDLREIQTMVEKSLVPKTINKEETKGSNKYKRGHSRPPSVVLDLLLQEKD